MRDIVGYEIRALSTHRFPDSCAGLYAHAADAETRVEDT